MPIDTRQLPVQGAHPKLPTSQLEVTQKTTQDIPRSVPNLQQQGLRRGRAGVWANGRGQGPGHLRQ